MTDQVIGAAIDVHREIGPGMLESVYRICLEAELHFRGLACEAEVALPLSYRDRQLNAQFRMDLVVAKELLIETKSVERLIPVHTAQVLTYLRLSGLRRALLINFNVPRLMQGIRRISL